MTPGRAGTLLGLLRLGGKNVSGAGLLDLFISVLPEMVEMRELS